MPIDGSPASLLSMNDDGAVYVAKTGVPVPAWAGVVGAIPATAMAVVAAVTSSASLEPRRMREHLSGGGIVPPYPDEP